MADMPNPGDRAGKLGERAWEVARFGVAGVLNTAFGFGLYSLLVLLGLAVPLALLLATVAGVFFNFLTFGGYAFQRLQIRRLPRFLVAYGGIYVFNLALLEGLRRVTGLGPIVAQLACLVIVAPTAYLILKAKVFKEIPE
jgi:putative flippase GtrA